MKKMKLLLAGFGLMATTFALQSCLDDENDNTTIYPNALVTVKPDAENTSFRMQLDEETALWPVNMRQSPFGTKEVRALAMLWLLLVSKDCPTPTGRPLT